jgi:predicted PurR-regulated permease PerM
MSEYIDMLFTSEGLAIAIPAIIFIITVYLIVKRLISFLITLILLVFAIVSGLAIVNHKTVGEVVKGEVSEQRYEELKQSLSEFKNQIQEAFRELQQDLTKEDKSMQSRLEDSSDMLQRLDFQVRRLEAMVDEETPSTVKSVAMPEMMKKVEMQSASSCSDSALIEDEDSPSAEE